MSDEARVSSSLQLRTGNLIYSGQPTSFTADVVGAKGPTPGAFTVSTAGTDCDLSQLTTPGFCRIQNLDETNYVEFGVFSDTHNRLFVLGEVGPGETYVLKLSRNFGQDYGEYGTGTLGELSTLRFIANTASCVVVVEAFEA